MNEAQSATLSADQRKKVLDRVLATLQKRFYAPEKLNGDWQAAVERHRPLIESANASADFEKEVSDLLKELQTSHLGFFHRSARSASSRAALSATYLDDETEYGFVYLIKSGRHYKIGRSNAAGRRERAVLGEPRRPVFLCGCKVPLVKENVERLDSQGFVRFFLLCVGSTRIAGFTPRGSAKHRALT